MNTQPQKNWWGRNWKWFVPSGCLVTAGLAAGIVWLILSLVFGLIKSSGPYRDGLAAAQAHPAVQESIGTPIEPGMFASGNININGASGRADIAIPISGPNGKATVYVVGTKSAGRWRYSTMDVALKKDGSRIELKHLTP